MEFAVYEFIIPDFSSEVVNEQRKECEYFLNDCLFTKYSPNLEVSRYNSINQS